MTKPVRIFINGFGRIGRTVLRQCVTGDHASSFDVVGINDIAGLEISAYLFRYDSVFGPFPYPVDVKEKSIKIKDQNIAFHNETDIRTLDLSQVDVVVDCTGHTDDRRFVEAGLDAGAGSVLISGPSTVADKTIVIGANDQDLENALIVSNSSCTTNAIAPVLRTIDNGLGITSAHVTTIHCYTGSQPTVDRPGPSFERSRAAAVSMVPTTTSAAHQITQVLPELKGRLSVAALRVPCISVSAIDVVLQVADGSAEEFGRFLKQAFAASQLVGLCNDPCVSSDFRGRRESVVISLTETQSIGDGQVRLLGWYDNEWGFSARMLDMATRLSQRRF